MVFVRQRQDPVVMGTLRSKYRPRVGSCRPLCSVDAMDLVIQVYTDKQRLVRVYLDARRSSTTSKSAENGNYEAFVAMGRKWKV